MATGGSKTDTPTAKILANLKLLSARNADRAENDKQVPIVLLMTGSFCPVHRMHVHAMEEARRAVEACGHHMVVGGFLSPSHDSYVSMKLGDESIPASSRVDMCALATEASDFLATDPWESSVDTFYDYPVVANRLQRWARAALHDSDIQVAYVCGADHAMACPLYALKLKKIGVVVVQRGDNNQDFLALHQKLLSQLGEGNFWVAGVSPQLQERFEAEHVSRGRRIYYRLSSRLPGHSSEDSDSAASDEEESQHNTPTDFSVSSTKVRKYLRAHNYSALEGLVHPAVIDYLRDL
mmetsp:Transcript_11270/g.31622  ORF Transcript_11270/g.31622 Transcript_11270/m.31622 type:complete len:295 (+) Transcript_11270:181-1065(+)|eukprot:CAMPEP_0119132350 /NCGR_PEP_ID=MMETSP1310-20130426/11789_1 /TAXON_ID=464262 /ORGANISM="Genus nov. species nov., Strain RCC2339" /LENGTH=294 /DNA_ID=CAMNT_0007122979 /DNA_START=128 /DNA_END=1012 /DNA_ORIENTATION=+